MKRIISVIFTVTLFAGSFSSCQKDEITAPPVVSELKAYPGKYRAKVEFMAPKESKTGKVFYGNGKCKEFTVDDPGTIQSMVVEDLSEGEQILRVVTFNVDGVSSNPKGTKVIVYGDSYEKDLVNRKLMTQKTLSPTSIEMFFSEKMTNEEIGVRILFINTSGARDSVMMGIDKQSIVIRNIDLSKAYHFCTVYKPSSDFIDEFVAEKIDAKEAAMKNLEKEVWKIAGCSDEDPAQKANSIIDNDIATIWHSQNNQMPHWITVDMQSEKKFDGFHFIQSQTLGDAGFGKNFRFEISNDNKNWIIIMEGKWKATAYKQTFSFEEPVVSRFFKITFLNQYNGSPSAQMAEVDLFNELNVSGTNGKELPALVNAKQPFEGDGSNLFPAMGQNRMQKVVGWTHNNSAYITFDSVNSCLCAWSAAVWGIGDVTNGKVYQSLSLLPGDYLLKIDTANTTDPACVDMFGAVAKGVTLPDYVNVTTAPEVLGKSDLVAHQQSVNTIPFTVDAESIVTIGVVYNTHNIYGVTGIPWSDMYIRGFELLIK